MLPACYSALIVGSSPDPAALAGPPPHRRHRTRHTHTRPPRKLPHYWGPEGRFPYTLSASGCTHRFRPRNLPHLLPARNPARLPKRRPLGRPL